MPRTLFSDPDEIQRGAGDPRDATATKWRLFMVRDPRWVENRLWIFPHLKDEAAYLRQVRYQTDSWRLRRCRQHRAGVDAVAARPGVRLPLRLG